MYFLAHKAMCSCYVCTEEWNRLCACSTLADRPNFSTVCTTWIFFFFFKGPPTNTPPLVCCFSYPRSCPSVKPSLETVKAYLVAITLACWPMWPPVLWSASHLPITMKKRTCSAYLLCVRFQAEGQGYKKEDGRTLTSCVKTELVKGAHRKEGESHQRQDAPSS